MGQDWKRLRLPGITSGLQAVGERGPVHSIRVVFV